MWKTEGIVFTRQKFHASKGGKYQSQLPIAGYDECCSLKFIRRALEARIR